MRIYNKYNNPMKPRFHRTKKGVNMIRVELKDGTILNCSIYETGKQGEYPILNYYRIEYLFSLTGTNDYINFQTETIQGKFHPSNIVHYTIHGF